MRQDEVCTTASPETLSGMLERLQAVIAHTTENAHVANKIADGTREVTQRLGFTYASPKDNISGAIGGNPTKDSGPPAAPTVLQRLDALITQLGDTNIMQQRVNNENDDLRAVLSKQL
jgi:hypothetical protein